MDNQILSAILGAFVILSGIGIVFALILGFKQIGTWYRTTFRSQKYIPTQDEMAEFRQNAEAVKLAAKALNSKDLAVK